MNATPKGWDAIEAPESYAVRIEVLHAGSVRYAVGYDSPGEALEALRGFRSDLPAESFDLSVIRLS